MKVSLIQMFSRLVQMCRRTTQTKVLDLNSVGNICHVSTPFFHCRTIKVMKLKVGRDKNESKTDKVTLEENLEAFFAAFVG